jgi:hypothetical protein
MQSIVTEYITNISFLTLSQIGKPVPAGDPPYPYPCGHAPDLRRPNAAAPPTPAAGSH